MLTRENTALVVLDVQGKLAQLMHRKEDLFRNLGTLIEGMRLLNVPIVWMEQYPRGLGPTAPEVALHISGLEPMAKVSFSACGLPPFLDRLRALGRKQVVLSGIETHICVYQTARDLLREGYHVEIAADAVASRAPENRQLALDKAVRAGAELTCVEMALFELVKEGATDEFRRMVNVWR